jgi:hypothetical protein
VWVTNDFAWIAPLITDRDQAFKVAATVIASKRAAANVATRETASDANRSRVGMGAQV